MIENKLTPKEAYKIGDIVEYKVKYLFTNYCELIDEKTEITSYLQGTAKLILSKGQTVKCRILAVSEKHPKIELVDISEFEQNKDGLSEEKLINLLNSRVISWSIKDFVKLLLTEDKEKSFESQCHKWIQNLLNKKIDLHTVKKDCSDLLELSELLNICYYNERDFYQERLTLIIEQIEYYIRAAELIENDSNENADDNSNHFIDNLFNKLRISGFVYHPIKNFNILSCLFRLKPELMHNRIKELLDIISAKNIQIWEREPFCSALIKLLELYIRECDGMIDKTKDNKTLIDCNVLALSIQLLLVKDSNDSSIVDYQLNAARLCVLSSYLYHLNPETLVNTAYFTLFNSNAKLPAYTIENINVLPHYIFSSPCGDIDTINSFSQGNGRLLITEDGIQILSSASERKNLRPVFPAELKLWKNLQVFLPSKPETSLTSVRPNDIAPYQSVWSEIETEFFNINKNPVTTNNKNKKQHRIEETVSITFISQDLNDKNKFYCQIEDEIGGNGFIYIKDIVSYSITASLRHFYAPDGSRLVFPAKIIDKEDNLFKFSMLEDIKKFFSDDYYSYDEEIVCSMGSAPNSYGMAPAITQEGVSVSLQNAGDFKDEGIGKGSIVRCRLIGAGSGTFHITCNIISFADSEFDMNTAFRNLLDDFSTGKIPESITQQEEEQILESDKLINESYVKGLICMIDRMALIDSEYVKSFNYLGFARILCLLIGWESQAAYYKGRMDIIAMLHDFAQNSKVDEEKLVQLENANAELFNNNAVLRERFMQLQTVSFIDRTNKNAELFNRASSDSSLKNLASLVLAYNITKSNGLDSSANDIHNKIIQLLNLKGYETGLKCYGSGLETEEIEYKTSIVFYAENNSSLPNPIKQMDEILQVINSFFNTVGGTLYIGVNNFGYGVGIEEDLKTSIYYGDKDKYIRSILDAVALTWGNKTLTYIQEIGYDKENIDKDVVIVKILPIHSGLPYKNYWYIRKGGTTRKLTELEFNEYQAMSRQLQSELPVIKETITEDSESHSETVITTTVPFIASKDDDIKTSRIRKNVLAEWDDPDNYVEPVGLFKFLSGGKFRKIDKHDFDEQSLLTLAVKESEIKGYMVLGYETGHIVKVSVEELLEYTNREYSRNMESKLIFASIADKNDGIITISQEDKARGKVVIRLDQLSNIEEGRLMDSGKMLFNEGLISKVLAYDVIPSRYIEEFKGILDRPRTIAGHPENSVTKRIIEKLHQWGIIEI